MAGSRGNRMAGEKKLSPEEQRAAYRARLQTDDAERAKRIERIEFHEGLDSLPENYDDKVVAKVLRGSWGKDDLKRYNHVMRDGGISDDPKPDPKPAADPKPTIDVTGDVTGPVITKPEPTVRPVDGHDLPGRPIKPGKPVRGGGSGNNTNEQSIIKTIDFGDFYGGTVGHVTGNSGDVVINQQDQSTNTAGGDAQYNWQSGDYRPSFMRYF